MLIKKHKILLEITLLLFGLIAIHSVARANFFTNCVGNGGTLQQRSFDNETYYGYTQGWQSGTWADSSNGGWVPPENPLDTGVDPCWSGTNTKPMRLTIGVSDWSCWESGMEGNYYMVFVDGGAIGVTPIYDKKEFANTSNCLPSNASFTYDLNPGTHEIAVLNAAIPFVITQNVNANGTITNLTPPPTVTEGFVYISGGLQLLCSGVVYSSGSQGCCGNPTAGGGGVVYNLTTQACCSGKVYTPGGGPGLLRRPDWRHCFAI